MHKYTRLQQYGHTDLEEWTHPAAAQVPSTVLEGQYWPVPCHPARCVCLVRIPEICWITARPSCYCLARTINKHNNLIYVQYE